MTREFNEEKLTRLMDGDLSPDERKLVEVHLEGDRKSLKQLHAMLQTRDLVRELPRHKCPVDLSAKVRDIRNQDSCKKVDSIEMVFFRMLARVGVVAAVIGIALFISLRSDVDNREHFKPVDIESRLPASTANHRAMKVSSDSGFDIFDSSFKPELLVDLGGFKLSASQKKSLTYAVTFHMNDYANDIPALRDLNERLRLLPVLAPDYNLPVYRYAAMDADSVKELIAALRDIDSGLEIGEKVSEIISSTSNNKEPVDIFLLIEIPRR